MILDDIQINKVLTDREIEVGISAAMKVRVLEVVTVSEIPSIKLADSIRVMCHRIVRSGDFPLQLSIYLYDRSLDKIDEAAAMEVFCEITKSDVLISDGNSNPYSRILISHDGVRKRVYLAPERLDEFNEFVIKDSS
jgi:hypothetical protein